MGSVRKRSVTSSAVLVAFSVVALIGVLAMPTRAAAPSPLATWELNEPPDSSVMVDSSGNGFHGEVGNDILTGRLLGDATGYRFARIEPETPPARPGHNVVVPHDDDLNPGSGDYVIEVRYRTRNAFGNLIQKGQSSSPGGFWKIESDGQPTCLFRGPTGITNAVRSKIAVDDNEWHTIRCERTTDAVELYVDGVFQGRNTGLTGPIGNDQPVSFGGKHDCNQTKVYCDYFGGHVDWVRLTTSAR